MMSTALPQNGSNLLNNHNNETNGIHNQIWKGKKGWRKFIFTPQLHYTHAIRWWEHTFYQLQLDMKKTKNLNLVTMKTRNFLRQKMKNRKNNDEIIRTLLSDCLSQHVCPTIGPFQQKTEETTSRRWVQILVIPMRFSCKRGINAMRREYSTVVNRTERSKTESRIDMGTQRHACELTNINGLKQTDEEKRKKLHSSNSNNTHTRHMIPNKT